MTEQKLSLADIAAKSRGATLDKLSEDQREKVSAALRQAYRRGRQDAEGEMEDLAEFQGAVAVAAAFRKISMATQSMARGLCYTCNVRKSVTRTGRCLPCEENDQ